MLSLLDSSKHGLLHRLLLHTRHIKEHVVLLYVTTSALFKRARALMLMWIDSQRHLAKLL